MKVLIGITGSIAAYKTAELVNLLKKKGAEVKVIMTQSALNFIGELTLRTLSQNPIYKEMFPKTDDWHPDHISLSDWCDIFVIAPCTANVIAKISNGIADDLLTATVLACQKKIFIAPAMNEKMFTNPITQRNIEQLNKINNFEFIEPETGRLACGYSGKGRMATPSRIMEIIYK